MKPTLSPEQKEHKRQRDTLQGHHNRLKMAFSMGKVKTWNDWLIVSGLTTANLPNREFTKSDLLEQLKQQTDELERKLNGQSKPIPSSSTRQQSRDGTSNSDDEQLSSESNNEHSEKARLTHTDNHTIVDTSSSVGRESETKVIELELLPNDAPIPDVPKRPLIDNAIAEVYDEKNNYGLVDSQNWDVFHYWFQKKAIAEVIRKIKVEKKRGLLVIANTGTGKTFICGGVTRLLEDEQFHEGKTWSHIPYLYVTRASIVTQTERVLDQRYHLGKAQMEVVNIEKLRSSAGRLWVTEKMEIRQGKEEYIWEWKKNINPCVILWDECQALKNDDSTQHKIAAAYNDLKTNETYQLFVSATPFTRVSEAKCFAVSTRRDISHLGFPDGTKLSNATWPAYAHAIAKGDPKEYNEAACERLMKDLDDYVISVKNVRPQFDAINLVESITFETEAERKFYAEAWDRYLEEKRKLDAIAIAEGRATGGLNELVAFQKFRMAAEMCRKEHLARELYNIVQNKKKAAVCAFNFKGSIISVVKILVEKYNVPRDQISLVWGGGQTDLTKKQKDKKKILELQDKFIAMGMSAEEMLEQLGLDEVEDRIIEELDPSLRLGNQSPDERQKEIDKFQSGKSLYCLFTFRAGGVGLSLHHTDEFSTRWDDAVEGYSEWFKTIEEWNSHRKPEKQIKPGKARRKESGYAYEEDIPFIPIRPRELISSVTYSAIELVQGLGRCPRLTSLSDTVQRLLHYLNTIEDDVKAIVSCKLRCLSKVVRNREKWMDVAVNGGQRTEATKHHLEDVPDEETGGQIGDVEE